MQWFTTAIADPMTLRVLLEQLQLEVADAKSVAQLETAAQVYVITETEFVRLRFNEAALLSLRTLGTLAFYECDAPLPRDRINPLVMPWRKGS